MWEFLFDLFDFVGLSSLLGDAAADGNVAQRRQKLAQERKIVSWLSVTNGTIEGLAAKRQRYIVAIAPKKLTLTVRRGIGARLRLRAPSSLEIPVDALVSLRRTHTPGSTPPSMDLAYYQVTTSGVNLQWEMPWWAEPWIVNAVNPIAHR